MARKTRKEKIIANLRRKLEITKNVNQKWEMRGEKLEREVRNEKAEFSLQNISLQNPASHFPPLTSTYLVKDLRKTFILTTLAISLEFMIYIVWK